MSKLIKTVQETQVQEKKNLAPISLGGETKSEVGGAWY